MKSVPSIIKFIYFLLFPILLVYPNNLWEGRYINYIYVFFCFGLCFFFQNKNGVKSNKITSFFGCVLLLVLIANVFSAISSFNIELSDYIATTLRYLSYFILASFLFNTTKSQYDLFFWIKSFLFGFLLSLIVIILDSNRVGFVEPVFKMTTFESKETLDIYFRAYGAYLSPISAGVFLLNTFVILNTTMLYVKFKKKITIVLYGILFLTVVCIIMTASRTALVGLIIYLLLATLQSKQRVKILLIAAVASLAIFYSGIIDVYIENILLRNERDTHASQNVLEGSGRFDTFINSLKLYFDWRTFFFGVGPSEYSKGDGIYSLAHNGFLSVLLCYGVIGFILFYRVLKFIYNQVFNNTFLKKLFYYYLIVNSICFISSDGPVTHFWMINFIVFLYFIFIYSMMKKLKFTQVQKTF